MSNNEKHHTEETATNIFLRRFLVKGNREIFEALMESEVQRRIEQFLKMTREGCMALTQDRKDRILDLPQDKNSNLYRLMQAVFASDDIKNLRREILEKKRRFHLVSGMNELSEKEAKDLTNESLKGLREICSKRIVKIQEAVSVLLEGLPPKWAHRGEMHFDKQ